MSIPWKLSYAVARKIARASVAEIVHRDMFQVVVRDPDRVIFRNMDSPSLFYELALGEHGRTGDLITCPQVVKRVVTRWEYADE